MATRRAIGVGVLLLATAGCWPAQERFPPRRWTNSLGMEFVRIGAGKFTMGTPRKEAEGLSERFGTPLRKFLPETPPHEVVLSRDFLIARYEVTVAQFRRFVEATGYRTDAERGGGATVHIEMDRWEKKAAASWKNPGFPQTDRHPVVCVSWNDAMAFAEWLDKVDSSRPRGWRYRLPTEAEWEFAARGGEGRRYPWGNEWSNEWANFADRRSGLPWARVEADDGFARTAPVGSFSPKGDTPEGVADLCGNVWEWCLDWFEAGFYERSPRVDPLNDRPGSQRVERGGSWAFTEDYCRSAFRMPLSPEASYDNLGFRLVLVRE